MTTDLIPATPAPVVPKTKVKKIMLISLGSLAVGIATFFGIKLYKKHKNNNDDTDTQTPGEVDNQNPVPPAANYKPRTSLPAVHAGTAFPLRLRAKGDTVLRLQQSLIRSYGAKILPRFGADGDFGTELQAALRAKGYAIPLSEADYQKITQEKPAGQNVSTPKTIVAFDPAAVAKGIYDGIISKDFAACLTLLKAIRDTSTYALVSGQLQQYTITGVRQTLVNALLSTFTQADQKTKIQIALKAIGLKFNGSKWTLSGLEGLAGVKSDIKEGSPVKTTKVTLATESTRGLIVLPSNLYLGKLKYVHDGLAYIEAEGGGSIRIHEQFIKKQSK